LVESLGRCPTLDSGFGLPDYFLWISIKTCANRRLDPFLVGFIRVLVDGKYIQILPPQKFPGMDGREPWMDARSGFGFCRELFAQSFYGR